MSDNNEIKSYNVFTDKVGQTIHRYKQYYKGIELAEVQLILHEKNGIVSNVAGKLISGLNLDVTPSLSESKPCAMLWQALMLNLTFGKPKRTKPILKKNKIIPMQLCTQRVL